MGWSPNQALAREHFSGTAICLSVRLKAIESGCDETELHGWGRTKLLGIGDMPPELKTQRAKIIKDLKDALTAHKGSGIYSSYSSYEETLETE